MPLVSSRDRRSPGRVGRVTSADGRGPDSSGLAPGSREGRELVEEVEQHDDGDPDDPDGDREPVEVPFGDAGTPEAGRDPVRTCPTALRRGPCGAGSSGSGTGW